MPRKKSSLPRAGSMIERLNRLYGIFQGDDRLLIIINADPDAIASAMALKRLLWRRVSCVTISRINTIKRPDNLSLVKFLNLPILPMNEVKLERFSRLAMVDSQPHHMEGALAKAKYDVIIDHHPLGDSSTSLLDVRPDYGANSTIMTEYLRSAKIKPNRKLATALFYGIKTDTDNFVRQGHLEDVRAFRFLFPLINQGMLRKIENSELDRTSLKYLQMALEKVKIRKERAYVYLGKIDNPDTLVMIADFFMRVHDINTSVAAGVFKDTLVVIFRAVGYRSNVGKWAAEAFGRFGSAGGHKAMARAEVPIANLDAKMIEREKGLERFFRRQILK